MAFKAILSSLDGLDDATKAMYTKRDDGKFALDVEGMVDKGKLDEFRTTNLALKAELEKLAKQMESFGGIDPAKYKEMADKMQSEEEKKLLAAGNIDEVVTQRTEKMRADFLAQIAAKDKAIAKSEEQSRQASGERDSYIVTSELQRLAGEETFGFHNNVAELLKERVLKEFKYLDGKVTQVKADGSPVFGKNGDAATLNEFLVDVAKNQPFLVRASTGGGARNGGQGQHGQKTMRRAEFDALPADRKMSLMTGKDKVALVDA